MAAEELAGTGRSLPDSVVFLSESAQPTRRVVKPTSANVLSNFMGLSMYTVFAGTKAKSPKSDGCDESPVSTFFFRGEYTRCGLEFAHDTGLNKTFMEKPLVSICIPTRNTQRWVREAIDSALAQTWERCEVIVIDDGSKDETPEILKSYGSRITWRSTQALGGNAARNLAISLSSGEWIQFLDADDYLLPDKIASQFEEVGVGTDLDLILSTELLQYWSDGHPLEPVPKPKPSIDDFFAQWFLWECPGTQGGLWRKSALARIGNWNEEMPCCQDYELYARALRQGLRMKWTDKPLSVYRIWSEKTVCRRDPVQLIQVKTKLIDEMLAFLREGNRWKELYGELAGRTCFEMCRTLAKFDIDSAALYHRERLKRGLVNLSGPAAPFQYRLSYWTIGFGATERLASFLR